MPSINNSGQQYQADDFLTLTLTGTVSAYRFVGLDGAHATSAGGVHDSAGITHTAGVAGDDVAVITCYSGLIECAEAIAQFGFVKPHADGSGRAINGTATDHCGRLLGAATAAGQLVECMTLRHRHT
ncbi:MAG: hypothetical protein RLZZ494_173 [Pseudomonadota bacterium]|jgi:hypothetical protein